MKKLMQWLRHPLRSAKKWYYRRVIRKAVWVMNTGLSGMGIDRAERHRLIKMAKELNIARAEVLVREKRRLFIEEGNLYTK